MSACEVCQVVLKAMLGVANDMSGDVGSVFMLYGLRVGEFSFSIVRECSCWLMRSLRGSCCWWVYP